MCSATDRRHVNLDGWRFVEDVDDWLFKIGVLVSKDNGEDDIDNEHKKHESDEDNGIVDFLEVAEVSRSRVPLACWFATGTPHGGG